MNLAKRYVICRRNVRNGSYLRCRAIAINGAPDDLKSALGERPQEMFASTCCKLRNCATHSRKRFSLEYPREVWETLRVGASRNPLRGWVLRGCHN